MSGFGKVSIDSQYEGFKYFKLRTPDIKKNETETTLVLRLLPSMKSYRDSGEWKFYYGQHYGYAGVNPRDPSRPRARPFACIQKKNKNKEIVVACPKCTQMAKFEARKKAREDELAKQHGVGDDKEARGSADFYNIKREDAKHKQVADWLGKHNCDKKFWINAMDKDGNFGVLQLSYTTTTEKLIPLLKKLSSGDETGDKVDAFDPGSGMWLKFTRSGRAPRVIDNITVFEDFVEVGGGKKAKLAQPAPMTQEQIEKALKVCPDLAKDVVKTISAETIQALVDCSGDPEDVDRIWPPEDKKPKAAPTTTTLPPSQSDESADEGDSLVDEDLAPGIDFAKKAAELKAAKAAEVKEESEEKKAPAPAVEEDDEEAALQKMLEAARAKKAAKAATTLATAAGLGKTVDNADDFLAQFEAK